MADEKPAKARAKKPAGKVNPPSADAVPLLSKFSIFSIALLSSKFDISPGIGAESTVEEILKYNATIAWPRASNGLMILFCDYDLSREKEGETGLALSASYIMAIEYIPGTSSEERKQIALMVTGAQGWSMFREYAHFLISQSNLRLPLLPLAPSSVDISDNSSFEEASV